MIRKDIMLSKKIQTKKSTYSMNHVYEIQTQAKLLYVDRKQTVVDSVGRLVGQWRKLTRRKTREFSIGHGYALRSVTWIYLQGIVKTHCTGHVKPVGFIMLS